LEERFSRLSRTSARNRLAFCSALQQVNVPVQAVRGQVVVAALSCSALCGCLEDPPEYVASTRIPPVVNYSQVVPPLSVVHEVDSSADSIHLTVPFRSEDLGDDVLAFALLDTVPGREPLVVGESRLPGASFEILSRSVDMLVTEFGEPGCHTLTLLLTQTSNAPNFRFEVPDETLATRLVWWISVRTAGEDVLLSDCASQGEQPVSGVEP
jgi:hypothetical protein